MNERIKALAEESKLMAFVEDLEIINAHDVTRVEKFAELIIRECIEEIEFQYDGGPEQEDGTHSKDWNAAIECVVAFIRHNFGIKKNDP